VTTPLDDLAFMERALFVAERGRGRTSPNPIVGAVVVSPDGVVVGQGAHLVAGGPHGEVVALDEAAERARGGTLYCTLEPCSHTGRTGPCVERILAAAIRRVVVAVGDPNPQVAGRGIAWLRARGVEVAVDVGRAEAIRQHAPFFTWVTSGRPFVTLKAAISADGFVGSGTAPIRLTGAAADRYFHRQRAEIDALAVGSGTMIVDDPLLTPRGAYRYRPLTRVVFDWRGRVPLSARLFSTLPAGPVIMVVGDETVAREPARYAELERRGVIIERFGTRALAPVVERLGKRQVLGLLVEGGPALHTAFFDAGLVDSLQWAVTPRTLGAGVPASPVFDAAKWRHAPARTTWLGADRLLEIDVHRPD
jgi:diaminohydroxyphosphoribosylaminopyrimidine deaminase/5-amino-6-(5-phosphoribosylamino)uracil reductase